MKTLNELVSALQNLDKDGDTEVKVLDTEFGKFLFRISSVGLDGDVIVIYSDMEAGVAQHSGRWG